MQVAKGKSAPAKVQVAKGKSAPAKMQVAKGKSAHGKTQLAQSRHGHRQMAHARHTGHRQYAAQPAVARHAAQDIRPRPVYARSSGGGYSRGGWGRGLSPAYGVQTTSCPDGTMATTAHGHTSVVRCIPI